MYEKETDKISIDKMTFNIEKKKKIEKDEEQIQTELSPFFKYRFTYRRNS